MNLDPKRLAVLAAAVAAVLAPANADAFPNPFKKKKKAAETVPAGDQMRKADMAAADLLTKARNEEAAGRDGAAMKGYERIITNYPYTSMAPAAQFRIAAAHEKNGKYEKAFEAYQKLITNYRQTPQFSEALDRQFGIAMQSRTQKTGRTLGFKSRMGPEEVVDMLNKVLANAPQGPHAAEAQFEIARVHEEEEERDQAIAAYRKVVLNYPRTALAREAQVKIGQTYLAKVEDGNRDQSNISKARAAFDEVPAQLFPNGSPEVAGVPGLVEEAATDSAYKTGKFYQKKGNYKAAMIYFADVLKNPGSPHYEDVRNRVNEMSSQDPKLMETARTLTANARSLTVQAAANLKNRAEYFGPPGPEPKLATNVRRPAMRNDYVPDTPLEPGDLPAVPGVPDSSLLDPNALPPPDTQLPPDLPVEAPAELPLPDTSIESSGTPETPPAPVEEKPALPADEAEQPKSN